jgi:hypothetical protein
MFRAPPSMDDIKPASNDDSYKSAKAAEIIYCLARSGECHERANVKQLPPWGSFQVTLSKSITKVGHSKVAFSPIIMAPPSDGATVYTTLRRAKEAVNLLGFEHIPIVSDMGLLSKAVEITWSHPREGESGCALQHSRFCQRSSHPRELAGVICISSWLCLEALECCDAGLQSLLHESGVFAAGTAQHILSGKDFDRAMRGLRIVDEALLILFFRMFTIWCEKSQKSVPVVFSNLLLELEKSAEKEMESMCMRNLNICLCYWQQTFSL